MRKYKLTDSVKLYHASVDKHKPNKIFVPRIPNLDYVAYEEEDKTPRICVSTNISGAIKGAALEDYSVEIYIYEPYTDNTLKDKIEDNIYHPTEKEVADVVTTREKWITCKCKMRLIKKIKRTKTWSDWAGFKVIEKY